MSTSPPDRETGTNSITPTNSTPIRTTSRVISPFGAFGRVSLGAPLARNDLSIAVSLLTKRLPNLRLAATQGELQYTQSIIIPSLRDLRIEFDPVADAAPKARPPKAA